MPRSARTRDHAAGRARWRRLVPPAGATVVAPDAAGSCLRRGGLPCGRAESWAVAMPDAGVRPRRFQRLSIVRLRTPETPAPDSPDDDRIPEAHLAYLHGLQDRGLILVNGPVQRADDPRFRGMTIYSVPADEARRLALRRIPPSGPAGSSRTWTVGWSPQCPWRSARGSTSSSPRTKRLTQHPHLMGSVGPAAAGSVPVAAGGSALSASGPWRSCGRPCARWS